MNYINIQYLETLGLFLSCSGDGYRLLFYLLLWVDWFLGWKILTRVLTSMVNSLAAVVLKYLNVDNPSTNFMVWVERSWKSSPINLSVLLEINGLRQTFELLRWLEGSMTTQDSWEIFLLPRLLVWAIFVQNVGGKSEKAKADHSGSTKIMWRWYEQDVQSQAISHIISMLWLLVDHWGYLNVS